MIIQKWLTVNSRGGARITQNRPALEANEVAVYLSLELPDELFNKPLLKASIKVPKEAVQQPEITTEIADNIKDVVEQNVGMKVVLEVIEPENEEEN